MRRIGRHAMIAAGGVLFALAFYTLMAAPGLLSDRDSTVPVQHETQR